MERRDFIQSVGQWLLTLSGLELGCAEAGIKTAVAAPSGSEGSVTLFLCGDVMTGRGIDQILPNRGDPHIHESYMKSALGYVEIAQEVNGPVPGNADFSYIWGDAIGVLDSTDPDLRIINLETSVTSSDDFWPGKGIHYRMHPRNTPALTAAGIDCCALANNHVLDWGYPGLEETLDTLHQADLQTAGAGRDLQEARTPAVFDLGEKGRVLVFAVASESSGVPAAWAAAPGRAGLDFISSFSAATVESIADQVRAWKRPGDVVLLSIHWGSNWGYGVPEDQREFAHQLIERADVDVIHGHSSHHPRGIEVHANRPIIYGCGDLVNDYEGIGGHEQYRPGLSLMYFVRVAARSGELSSLEMLPMRIRRFRLNRASAEEASWLAETLDRECRRLDARVALHEDRSLSLSWGNAASSA
jgi:poly-gamma-glutamate synthesis protein (capsule biosynthesis protein)